MGWQPSVSDIVKGMERRAAGKGASTDPPGTYKAPPGGYPDGKVPWNARLPNAMVRGGGDGKHPVPRAKVSEQRQKAIDKMKQQMIGRRSSANTVTPSDIRAAGNRVASRLRKRGVKGPVDWTYDAKTNEIVGPKGKRTSVPRGYDS